MMTPNLRRLTAALSLAHTLGLTPLTFGAGAGDDAAPNLTVTVDRCEGPYAMIEIAVNLSVPMPLWEPLRAEAPWPAVGLRCPEGAALHVQAPPWLNPSSDTPRPPRPPTLWLAPGGPPLQL